MSIFKLKKFLDKTFEVESNFKYRLIESIDIDSSDLMEHKL